MERAELAAEVAKVKWWHSIDLGDGLVTPGKGNSERELRRMKMPERLDGKSVLDIGAWDGFYSFEAERRGASRVLAVDSYAWDGRNWSNKDGFELARRALGSRVEDKQVEVLDISPQRVGEFDLVLFLGVLYHMRYPLLALERVASVTKEQLILETHVDLLGCGSAAMAFYPGKQLDGDSTNWWGPNTRAMEAMLKTVGFRRIELVTPPSLLRRLTHLVGRGHPRAVYHAWK